MPPVSSAVRILVVALLLGVAPAALAAPGDEAPGAVIELLEPIAAMDGVCTGPDDPDCHRTALTPEVATARLRTDILAGIGSGQARIVRMSLFPKVRLEAWIGAPEASPGGRTRWRAGIEGEPSSLLVVVGPRLTKSQAGATPAATGPFVILVRSLRLGNFEIMSLGGDGSRVKIARIDSRGALPCGVGEPPRGDVRAGRARGCCCRSAGAAGAEPPRGGRRDVARTYQAPTSGVPGSTQVTPIDLLVCYTPSAATWLTSGVQGLEAAVDAQVVVLNEALGRCQSGAYVAQVTFKAVAYGSENSSTIKDIWQYHLRPASTTSIPEAHSERDAVAADLVTLIVKKSNAQVAGYGDVWKSTATLTVQAQGAFSVVQAPQLSNDSLVHEIGHNLGCCHESTDTMAPLECGLLPYRHGFAFTPGASGTAIGGAPWATLMHTGAASGSQGPYLRIPWFSNADICLVGYGCTALGDYGTANNARMIRESVPSVALYR